MKQRIYLDHNASTPLDERVLNIIWKDLQENLGNPSSVHHFGQEMRNRVTKARRAIADTLGVHPKEVIFTSGGTEALNMCLRGYFEETTGHLITSLVEHSCVMQTVKQLEKKGCSVTYLKPGLWGAIKPEQVLEAIQPSTRLVTLMSVNNETGVKTDIEAIASLLYERRIPFVVDGVAHLGKELFTIPFGVSAICFSGHKLHAPKGIGMAIVRSHFKFTPLLLGGGQEGNRRGGTENVTGILALSEAISLLKKELPVATHKMLALRDKFEISLSKQLSGITINGDGPRICNTSNLCFEGIDGESLVMNLDLEGVAASHGSACSSGSLEPSRILLQMGLTNEQAASSIRFSLSRMTTEQEIDQAIEIIVGVVRRLRALNPSRKGKIFIPASNQ